MRLQLREEREHGIWHRDGGPLSPRHRRVAELIAEGYTDPAIAAFLGLTNKTVRSYAKRLKKEIGIHPRTIGRNPRVMVVLILTDARRIAERIDRWLSVCDLCGCRYDAEPDECHCGCHKEDECERSERV